MILDLVTRFVFHNLTRIGLQTKIGHELGAPGLSCGVSLNVNISLYLSPQDSHVLGPSLQLVLQSSDWLTILQLAYSLPPTWRAPCGARAPKKAVCRI